MDVQTLEKLIIEIEAKTDKLELQLKQLNKLYANAPKPKIDFDTFLGQKKLSELEGYYNKLKIRFENKIKANLDVASVTEAQSRLDKVGSIIDSIKGGTKNTTENMSRWGMIITGINQGVQLVKESFQQVKTILLESINKATTLAEAKSYFSGTVEEMEALRKATKETADDQSLIELSNKAKDMGISFKDQVLLFAMAKEASEKYGGDVSAGMERVIQASDGTVKGLRALGISVVDYKQQLYELSKQHGGRINELDSETQRQIRLEAIIHASGMTFEKATDTTRSDKDEWESWGVTINNQKRNLGQFLNDALMPVMKEFDNSDKKLKNVISALIGIGGAVIDILPSLITLITMKKVLGLTALTTAGQIETETAALIHLDTAAKGSAIWKLLGWAGAGAAAALFLVKQFQWMQNPSSSPLPKWMTTPSTPSTYQGSGYVTFAQHEKEANETKQSTQDIKNNTDAWQLAGKTIPQIQAHILDLRKKQLEFDQVTDAVEYNKIEREIKESELKLQELQQAKDAADKKKEIVNKYYEAVKFADKSYWDYLAKNMNEQIKKFRENGITEVQIEKYKIEEKKKIQEEYLKYLEELLKKETGSDIYKFNENGELTISGYGPLVPHNMNPKSGEPNPGVNLSGGNKNNMSGKESILNDWINSSQAATSAYNVFYESAMSGFDMLRIKAAETANDTTRFFVNMGNLIIQEIEQIMVKWALLNIISAMAGGPGVSILTMLGISSHEGGRYSVSDSGIRKLAGGGSFIVPQGYANDSYPLFVESGELVSVTAANKVTPVEQLSGQILTKMNVLALNMIDLKTSLKKRPMQINLESSDPYLTVKNAEGVKNQLIRNGVKSVLIKPLI
jgi:hypothetical protein